MSPKLTPAQTWLVHTLECLFMLAVIAGGVSIYQAVALGNYSVPSLAGIFGSAALAVIAKGASNSIQNNANILPALMDTITELQASMQQLPTSQAPLVMIHNTTPSVAQLQPILTEQPSQPVLISPTPVTPSQPQQVTPMVALPNTPHTGTAKPDDTQPFAAVKP